MSLRIQVNAEAAAGAPVDLIERAVRLTLAHERRTEAELSVTLLPDAEIQALNRDYLSRDRPTDVIAFSLGTEGQTLGDVYLGIDQAARQAEELGASLDEELVRLAVHGTLHVLGHDHPEGVDREESPMFVLQERLVGELLSGR
jgi:probable rRNA maturation factor